ncbi:unnamed protein product [Trichobilharzia regenti]|nr:unnamed protein product [Trichobilharzia regenti]
MSTPFDQLINSNLLDSLCLRILEVYCLKMRKTPVTLSPDARMHVINYTMGIIKSLCDPTIPNCVVDIRERIDYCFPSKIRPSNQFLNEIQLNVEKGKKKTLYISADKSVYPHVEPSVSLFFAHLMEHIMGQILQHIFSLFGASKQSKSPVCPIPSLHRKSKDYKDYAKEIQYLLRSSVQHLGIVVRIFGDCLSEELSQIRTVTESFLSECDDLSEVSLSARRLLTSIKSAQLVFDRASEVHGHITLLSECVDDAQEDQTRLLGSCLIVSYKFFLCLHQ